MWKLPSSACKPRMPGGGAFPSACWRKASSTGAMHSSGVSSRSTSLGERRNSPDLHHEGVMVGVMAGLIPCPLTLFVLLYALARGVANCGDRCRTDPPAICDPRWTEGTFTGTVLALPSGGGRKP